MNISLEMLGDRWSLLILRNMMLRNASTYKELLQLPEDIATNILADRLRKLLSHGIISTHSDPTDGRKVTYRLTRKGIDLAPVLAELVLWAAQHEQTGNQALIRQLRRNKANVVAQVRKQWAASAGRFTHR